MSTETKQRYWTFGNLRKKVWFWLAMCLVALTVYHQDAIRGQWKFDRLCKEDSGGRFYGKIEKGQGWVVDYADDLAYEMPFGFGNVAFVRYQSAKGERFDVTKKNATADKREEYVFLPVDESRIIRYKLAYTGARRLPDDPRFSRTHRAVIDLKDGRTLATYTTYSFRWTKPERVILNAPTGVGCPTDGGKSYQELVLQMGGWE
jgi:hypothetical protein